MKYLLIDDKRTQNCIDHIKSLEPNGKWEVTIMEYKKKRSLAQNALYHMWKPYLAKHFGYTDEEMHEELKYAFIGKLFM